MIKDDFQLISPGHIRVRFAPAPTGFLHVGLARTALFNYLFAKKNQGTFILRIEDTDTKRSDLRFEKDIMENLKWLGIKWDEGPVINLKISTNKQNQKYIGNYGPYRQSERTEIYVKYLQKLLDQGKAYYCFCPEEDLEAMRQYQMSRAQPVCYNGKCSQLSKLEEKKYLAKNKPFVIRLRTSFEKVIFKDLIRGKIEFNSENLGGNFILAKSFDDFLYNFTVVIDDFEMKISHIIRGEDHITNTAKQILVQKALGLPQPKYIHLPLILGADRSKLSKRHGAAAINEYRKQGYLPETLINFMAFLGWNPGDEREVFGLSSLIKEFSIERTQKHGAIFNIKRLNWLNGFYIRQKSLEKLTKLCLPYLISAGFIKPQFESVGDYFHRSVTRETEAFYFLPNIKKTVSFDYLKSIIALEQERMKSLSEIPELTEFFFKEKLEYPQEFLKWRNMTNQEINVSLDKLEQILSKISKKDFHKENLKKILILKAEQMGDKGKLLWPFRVALTGKKASAGPFEIAEILEKQRTLDRINLAKNIIRA